MHTTNILYRRGRSGTSTILGTLIFVGIMFTAVIPMLLVMKQADIIYEMRKHELGILDQERRDEEVYVYVFPGTYDSATLTLKVQNRGNLVVNVVQVWINDDHHILADFVLQPMSWDQMVLDDSIADFTPVPGNWYLIRITTDRGNIFSSDSGSLHFDSEGEWAEGMFAINFLISYPEAGWFDIDIKYDNENGDSLVGAPFQIHKSSSGPAFDFFEVLSETLYYVKITKNSELIKEDYVTIDWPNGPPVEWVFA